MKASIQNLIKEIKAVIFQKKELEFRDMSQVKALLALMTNHDSTSDVEQKVKKIVRNEESPSSRELSIDPLMEKINR